MEGQVELVEDPEFNPNERDLVVNYLIPAINNQELPQDADRILRTNLYLRRPHVFNADDRMPFKVHIFTPVMKKSPHSQVASRKANRGYWKVKSGPMPILDGLQVVAFKRRFDFYSGIPKNYRKTEYSMLEYRAANPPPQNNVGARILYPCVACIVQREY